VGHAPLLIFKKERKEVRKFECVLFIVAREATELVLRFFRAPTGGDPATVIWEIIVG